MPMMINVMRKVTVMLLADGAAGPPPRMVTAETMPTAAAAQSSPAGS
jgi:hypothetical protein